METTAVLDASGGERPSRGFVAGALVRALLQEDLNFLLTNRIPRRYATLFMGWFSRIEVDWIARASIGALRFFADDLELHEAKSTRFRSLHECFIRELRDGARPVESDPEVLVSPCDAIVGAHGRVERGRVIQAKGFPYALDDLLGDPGLVARHEGGFFVTLRLKANMYHRFHAPCPGRVREVVYVSGDTWNVNPIALARVERLFCRNERVVLDVDVGRADQAVTLVPVAAILVASIKLHFLDEVLDLRYRGKNRIACDAAFEKGDELGYFQAGSTIILFATGGFSLCDGIVEGTRIRTGQALLRGLRPGPVEPTRNGDPR